LHNFFLTKELLELLTLFEAHCIPASPYKGPALAIMAYGNLALRQFSDLNILVHKRPDVFSTVLDPSFPSICASANPAGWRIWAGSLATFSETFL